MSRRPAGVATSRLVAEVVAGAILLGLVAGIGWLLLAPEIEGEIAASGVAVQGPAARHLFSLDGWFAVVGAVSGVVLALAAMMRHHRRPIMTMMTLVGAGAIGSVVAWRVGVLLGPGPVDERAAGLASGSRITMPLALGAPGVLLIWPIASVVAMAIAAALMDDGQPWRSGASQSDRSGPSSPSSA